MGVLQDKKTGNYYFRISYFGKRYEKHFGKDKRLAKLEYEALKLEIRQAKHANQGWEGAAKMRKATKPKTFGEAAQEYMDERTNFKASSVAAYTAILKSNLLPAFGNRPLVEITEHLIRKYMTELSKPRTVKAKNGSVTEVKLSESRINTIMQLFRSITGQAYRVGDIPRDPCLAVKRLQEAKVKIDPFSDDDLRLALSCVTPHYRPFFTAQAYTGARPNELQALRWSDIDWVNEQISITKGLVRGHEGAPKTASGERLIPMTPPVKRVLLELKANSLVSLDDYVFTTKNGTPIKKHMDEVWRRALRKAKLRHRPSYQLRHTFVTQCIIKGFPLPYIAKVIGHSTIDTLIRHYAGWIDKASQEQEKKLKAMFTEDDSMAPRSLSVVAS